MPLDAYGFIDTTTVIPCEIWCNIIIKPNGAMFRGVMDYPSAAAAKARLSAWKAELIASALEIPLWVNTRDGMVVLEYDDKQEQMRLG